MILTNLIKDIRKIINDDKITIDIFGSNELCFNIYEKEIPIIVTKSRKVIIDSSIVDGILTPDVVGELAQIMLLIEKNIDALINSLIEEKVDIL